VRVHVCARACWGALARSSACQRGLVHMSCAYYLCKLFVHMSCAYESAQVDLCITCSVHTSVWGSFD